MLPYCKGDKLMGKFSKRTKYYYISTGEGHYNSMDCKSIYEVEYPDETTEQLTSNLISENVIS